MRWRRAYVAVIFGSFSLVVEVLFGSQKSCDLSNLGKENTPLNHRLLVERWMGPLSYYPYNLAIRYARAWGALCCFLLFFFFFKYDGKRDMRCVNVVKLII